MYSKESFQIKMKTELPTPTVKPYLNCHTFKNFDTLSFICFVCLFRGYTPLYSGFTPKCSGIIPSSAREPYGMLAMESGMVTCKASTLLAVLWLQPFFSVVSL